MAERNDNPGERSGHDARGDGAPGRWSTMADDIASGAKTSAPFLRRTGTRIGDWLAGIGWGKFFLLSILLLIFGGIAGESLFRGSPMVVVDRGGPAEKVKVEVAIGPQGVQVGPSEKIPAPPRPPAPPAPPEPPAPPSVEPATDPGSNTADASEPTVRLTEKGIQIVARDNGKRTTIAIDERGIRVTEAEAGAAPTTDAEVRVEGGTLVIPPGLTQDPEKFAEAIESARDKIEEIVNDQVDRQVAKTTRVYREQTGDWFMSFVLLLILTGIIVKVVLGSKKKAEVRAQAASATAAEEGLKRQLAEAQLKMMQAQVEPHFLFNTLASVDYLIETDPARASKMQKNLIQYLRAALPQMREGSTTLGKEIALCRAYLEILRVRMDDRLHFAITVPSGLGSAQFPPMMLQSLVENAIKHGLEPKAEGGSLTIGADVVHGMLRVTVADTGLGFGAGSSPGTGVGLANVRERLGALYGSKAKLLVEANSPSGTIARIEVPYSIDAMNGDAAAPDLAAQPA